MKIEIDPVMKKYDRIYKKLQNVLADLGGLFNTLTLIGNILVIQLNKKKFDYDLINKTFYQENQDSEKIHIHNKNIILSNNKINDNSKNNFKPQNISMSINNNLYKNNIDHNHAESNLRIKSSNNESNGKLSEDSLKISKINSANITNKNKEINSSNLLHNDLVKEENIQTRRIDDSTSRMNVELEELKIKQDKISDPNHKSIKPLNPKEPSDNEKKLKERIGIFLENSR